MRASSHTNCCGYIPITIMGGPAMNSEEQLQALIGIVQGSAEKPSQYSNKVYEIILNDKQAKEGTKLLKLMAALGFVLVCRMNNGAHDSWINVFHRCQLNGREYVAPKFKWEGLSVIEPIMEHQVPPVEFTRPEVPNPFLAKGKGVFNTAQIAAIVEAKPVPKATIKAGL